MLTDKERKERRMRKLFSEIYLTNDFEDPHSELAKRLGIGREAAKVQLYRWLYSVEFIRTTCKMDS